jgi:O-antigen ligase
VNHLAGLEQSRLTSIADWLVVAVAVSLPWSTSASAVFIALWLIAVLPRLGPALIWHEMKTPAGGLPVVIWGFAAIAMLWADVSWSERLDGLRGFHKLLLIPALLAQFRRSEQAKWAILGFFLSSLVLLILSWMTPYPGFLGRPKADVGVPVKDSIAQSGIFAICAFGLLGQAAEWWRTGQLKLAAGALFAATCFIANIVFVATARATLVIIAVLFVLFAARQFSWKGVLVATLVGGTLGAFAWASSPYLRGRVTHALFELQEAGGGEPTSVGLRLEFWRKSLEFVRTAPVVGHGTGTIGTLFRRAATGDVGASAARTDNPHNQIFAVAIQLGVVGTLLLFSMWIAHLALFRFNGVLAWDGLTIVVANVVGSLFATHLFDFTQGWLYVFGVGVLGGASLSQKLHENR